MNAFFVLVWEYRLFGRCPPPPPFWSPWPQCGSSGGGGSVMISYLGDLSFTQLSGTSDVSFLRLRFHCFSFHGWRNRPPYFSSLCWLTFGLPSLLRQSRQYLVFRAMLPSVFTRSGLIGGVLATSHTSPGTRWKAVCWYNITWAQSDAGFAESQSHV